MIHEQLLDYIKQELALGITPAEIKSTLLGIGWQATDIDEALQTFAVTPTVPEATIPTMQTTTTEQAYVPQSVPVTPLTQSYAEEYPKKGGKKMLGGVIVILTLVILGGAKVFGYNYFVGKTATPEKNIAKMMHSLSNVTSFAYSGDITVDSTVTDMTTLGMPPAQVATGEDLAPVALEPNLVSDITPTAPTTARIAMNFSGSSDVSDLSKPMSNFSFDITTNALNLLNTMTGPVTGEVEKPDAQFGLDLRTIGKTMYGQLHNVPTFGFMGFDTAMLKDQWIQINVDTVEQGTTLDAEGVPVPPGADSNTASTLSPDTITAIKKAIADSHFLVITETLQDEILGGVDTYHYAFTFDTDALKKLFVETNTIAGVTTSGETNTMIDTYIENMKMPTGELWIGKKDFLPYQVTMQLEIVGTDAVPASGTVSLNVLFKDFNVPVTIEEPVGAKTLEEIITTQFDTLNAMSDEELTKDTDSDGIPDYMETMTGTDPNKADKI